MEFKNLSKQAQATIAEVFESNPSMQETFATVDGSCFANKEFAFAHEKDMVFKAKSDKERSECYGVVTCKREEVLSDAKKPAKVVNLDPKAGKGAAGKGGKKSDDGSGDKSGDVDPVVTEANLADAEFTAKYPEAKLGDLIKDLKTA